MLHVKHVYADFNNRITMEWIRQRDKKILPTYCLISIAERNSLLTNTTRQHSAMYGKLKFVLGYDFCRMIVSRFWTHFRHTGN